MTTRVGVVADTHCPEFIERIPDSVFKALEGVDLIVHAGDINAASALAQLEKIAPVHAVRGDHDHGLSSLPRSREISVDGRTIVVVHGDRSRWLEEPNTFLWTMSLGYFRPHRGLSRQLRRRFPDADVIVYGHTHRADIQRVGGALLFNPGGVHVWNAETARHRLAGHPGWFEWCWLQVARHLRKTEPPSVGILEVGEAGIVPRIIGL